MTTTDAPAWELTPEAATLLGELGESPLPGARYARDVVGRHLEAIERAAVARDRAARGTLTVGVLAEAIRRLYTARNYLGHRAKDDAAAIIAALGPVEQAADDWGDTITSTMPATVTFVDRSKRERLLQAEPDV